MTHSPTADGVCAKCGWPLQSCDCCGLCGEPKCDCAKELNGDQSEPLWADADREMFGDDADYGIEWGNK
jgi:hypothetical protein